MAEVILFRPKAELDSAANLAGFVSSCRNDLTVFGADLRFDDNVWDVTQSLGLKGRGNERARLLFTSLGGMDNDSQVAMQEPFLAFSKAYLRYMHALRPTKVILFRLSALRTLEAVLAENGKKPDPIQINMGILNRAAQLLVDRYAGATAYRIGSQLEMLADFLSENRLTSVPISNWRSHIKRPGGTDRVGKEFDERRESKLPSESALDALPKVFRLATEPVDVIISSVAAIMCSAPDRINEVLLLPENCEVRQKDGEGGEAYGLRWWPAKGAAPMIKWIVPSMVGVVQEAIAKIRVLTEPARSLARWYEERPNEVYLDNSLEHLRCKEWLSTAEVCSILGFAYANNVGEWCKTNHVDDVGEVGERKFRFADVQRAVVAMLPSTFPVLCDEVGLKFRDALLIVLVNQLHSKRATYPCMIEPISINQINTGLGTRVEHGFGSIFSRLGFTNSDGSPIKVTTHQFRHYLNTLAQGSGLSQLDIAKWSGRKDINQNAAYDHTTPAQRLQKIRDAVGDDGQMFGALADLPKRVLIPRDEFARLIVPTAHTTDLGFCVHDYAMSPCQLHADCINCQELVCVKGDEVKIERLRQTLNEARRLLDHAMEAVGEGYAGSDRWFERHKSAVERLSQLCTILDDPNVPPGAVVQLSPPKSGHQVEVGKKADLPSRDWPVTPVGLLADVMKAMGG